MQIIDSNTSMELLLRELQNFESIATSLLPKPGEVPRLNGIDVWGDSLPLNGSVGGDHIIYVDFKQRFDLDARIVDAAAKGRHDVVEQLRRCRHKAGIAVVDVAGHRITDALMAAMLHQAFLVGALYELEMSGDITQRLFENLNTRFHHSSGAHKFIALSYVEVSEDARFRFLSAAQPLPVVFSKRHDWFVEMHAEGCISFPPLGTLPSLDAIDRGTTAATALGFKDNYQLNERQLMGAGDVMLLYTDGLAEHRRGGEAYFPRQLEQTLRRVRHRGAREIFEAIRGDILDSETRLDDISVVVVKLHE
jgi:serine phosphatase RsbU (regulator of sigma subunit)